MGSNRFGNIFTFTTWGESHGKMLGCVIDGCPAGLSLSEDEVNLALAERKPGRALTSPRQEEDLCEITSGLYQGFTTGAPISFVIRNKDVDMSKYEPIKDIFRPGHAQYTYFAKYGIYDPFGGGRASARETACRVCAGLVAKKILETASIEVCAFLKSIASYEAFFEGDFQSLKRAKTTDPIFCPDPIASKKMQNFLQNLIQEGESIGGLVEINTTFLPPGLGDPIYEKLEANLGKALLSIPAVKGVVFGNEHDILHQKGSLFRDALISKNGKVTFPSNHAAGILGGISSGMPLMIKVFFKPTSSVAKPIESLNASLHPVASYIPQGSRHDPCVAIRGVVVAEAMVAIALADALLASRLSRL
jgi:chorismate synthase